MQTNKKVYKYILEDQIPNMNVKFPNLILNLQCSGTLTQVTNKQTKCLSAKIVSFLFL